MNDQPASLLEVDGLVKRFRPPGVGRVRSSAAVPALNGVDLTVAEGEVVAVVGESGCGKTTLARCVVGLLRPNAGSVRFGGRDLAEMGSAELRHYRRNFQMVFQNPEASLDPELTVEVQVAEPLKVHQLLPGSAIGVEVARLLEAVGLPRYVAQRLPSELSGGQLQRVCIARALACRPRFLVADEPVASLDLPARAEILGLLSALQRTAGLAVLLITHDLAAARRLAHRVCVMYAGRICESGKARTVLEAPLHPYSAALLAAEPRIEGRSAESGISIPADRVEPDARLACPYATHCPIARQRCRVERVALRGVLQGHNVACHFPGEV